MRITVTTRGGQFNPQIPRVKSFDVDALEASTARRVEGLVAAALNTLNPGSASAPVRDGKTYTIEIDDDGRLTTLKQRDGSKSPEFAALQDFLDTLPGR